MTLAGTASMLIGALNRWYMYWPASTKRCIVAVPPLPIAVPGPESHCAVSTFAALSSDARTSTLRKRVPSSEVNHSERRVVRESADCAAAARASRVAVRSARLSATASAPWMVSRTWYPWACRVASSCASATTWTSIPDARGLVYSVRSYPSAASRSTAASSRATRATRDGSEGPSASTAVLDGDSAAAMPASAGAMVTASAPAVSPAVQRRRNRRLSMRTTFRRKGFHGRGEPIQVAPATGGNPYPTVTSPTRATAPPALPSRRFTPCARPAVAGATAGRAGVQVTGRLDVVRLPGCRSR